MASSTDPALPRPFCLTIVADFGGARSDEPVRAEPGEFQALLHGLRPRIDLRTFDLLTGAPRQVEWRLAPAAIRDLDPEPLLARCPLSAPLLAWRRDLLQVARTGTGAAALLDALDRLWPEVPAEAGPRRDPPLAALRRDETGLDALLDAVETPGGGSSAPRGAGEPAAPGARERLLGILEARAVPWETRLRQARIAAEQALARQAGAILHDPALRDREAAWRCLWAVLEDADLRGGGLRLQIVPAPRGECAAALEAWARRCEEGWDAGPAPGLIAIDHAAGDDGFAAALFAGAAGVAGRLGCRVVVPLDPEFLGDAGDRGAGRPADVAALVGGARLFPARAALAGAPGWGLAVTCNRFLFRPPWSPEEGPTALGAAREPVGHAGGPYAHAVWIAARGAARAARSGGPEAAVALDAVRVGGIATRPVAAAGAAERLTPLEFVLGVSDARLLAQAGLAPLTAELDQDAVTLRGLGAAPPAARAAAGATGDAGRRAPGMTARFEFPAGEPPDRQPPAPGEEPDR
jgi:hypothetical protein